MIKDQLLSLLKEAQSQNKLFTRTLLKGPIQDNILNFVYNHKTYKKLIFTGGTCLRKIYNLPRLSEDLDFDFLKELDIGQFCRELENYFVKTLQYKNLETKIAGNRKTIFLKFPEILSEIGLVKTKQENSLLFVRCDFSYERSGIFNTEINSISSRDFVLFVLSYDLRTLFANKIIAFLKRRFFRGSKQTVPFKGRDLFDLVWFFEKSEKSDFALQPNWERVFQGLGVDSKSKVLQTLLNKAKKIDKKDIYQDLPFFIESRNTVDSFSKNFVGILEVKIQRFSKHL